MENHCLVTRGVPTRMTKISFFKACQKYREAARSRKGKYNDWCLKCLGKHIPKNVTFVTIDELKEGAIEMTVKKMKFDECEMCGEQKRLSNNYGKMICSTCISIFSSAKIRPQVVIEALRENGNLPENNGNIDSVDSAAMENMRSTIARLQSEIETYSGDVSKLQEKEASIMQDIDNAKSERDDLSEVNSVLNGKLF